MIPSRNVHDPALQPRPGRMIVRGLLGRCARCGSGRLFVGWFKMVPDCPRCAHHFEREEGFFLGALTMNLIVTEGTLIALLAVVVSRGNSGIPLSLWIAGVAAALLVPLLFYPFSKTLWSAIDLAMRSTMGESFDGSGAQIGFNNRARNRGSGRRIDGSLVESNHPETANSNSNNSTTNTSTGSP